MGIDLKDIGCLGKYAQRQILEQIKSQPARKLPKLKSEFDSVAEAEYYMYEILPKLRTGEITECEKHRSFVLLEATEYMGKKLTQIVYTPDFVLTYSTGRVVVVEVKGTIIKKLQRDYHIRIRLFIEKYCRPNGWEFKEHLINQKSKKRGHSK